ncbi:MAG: anhydro-N-acetylmuramic acid kinase [Micrococcaceae bacterium]
MKIIGMMCGTSYDAIDAGAVDLTLENNTLIMKPLGMISGSYSDELRDELHRQMPPAPSSFEEFAKLDTRIGQAFAEVAQKANEELCDGKADVVASHGQTIYHWFEQIGNKNVVHGTLQIGQPAWIAEETGCTVVSDFRTRDVAAGGQGAPLISAFDQMWLSSRAEEGHRSAALNLGGIANATVLLTNDDGKISSVAFDTGPANALLDVAITAGTDGKQHYDPDGKIARSGAVNDALLQRFLAEPYYQLPASKTTGKELFHSEYMHDALDKENLVAHGINDDSTGETISLEDFLATLTELTAVTVADGLKPYNLTEVIVNGGGIQNKYLMERLQQLMGHDVTFSPAEDLGLESQAKEAYCFAVLAFCTIHDLPATIPSCTGAKHASILGSITPGKDGLHRLLEDAEPISTDEPLTMKIVKAG